MRLALLLAAAIALSACDSRAKAGPLTFERMRDQPRYEAYGRSAYFSDGMAMRQLEAGVVPRESAASDPAITGLLNGAPVRQIPVAVTRGVIARGRERYDVFCRPCHDVNGAADTPVAHNMQLRPPPSLLDERIRALEVGQIFEVIGHGYGLMPSYAWQLPPQDRWAVVAYVRALQLRDRVRLDGLSPDLQSEAEKALDGGRSR